MSLTTPTVTDSNKIKITEIINEIKKETSEFKDISQVPSIVIKAMIIVEKYRNLSGQEKKELVEEKQDFVKRRSFSFTINLDELIIV